MIQRPQSIFLLITIIALITMTMVPIWSKTVEEDIYSMCMCAWFFYAPNLQPECACDQVNIIFSPYVLIGVFTLSAVGIAVYTLRSHTNRKRQLRLVTLSFLIITALLGWILYLATQKNGQLFPDVPGTYRLGCTLLAMAIASNGLALLFIKKDEKLVKSAERIR